VEKRGELISVMYASYDMFPRKDMLFVGVVDNGHWRSLVFRFVADTSVRFVQKAAQWRN